MPEDMPEDMPDRMPNRMSEDMSDRMPEDMPEDMPDRMPNRMSEDMSDRMPNKMSDRMPEDVPVRTCINVMVGITRSKVSWGATNEKEPSPAKDSKTGHVKTLFSPRCVLAKLGGGISIGAVVKMGYLKGIVILPFKMVI